MGLFRLWRWFRAAVLELTGVIVCLMVIGFPLTDRADNHSRTAAPASSQSWVAGRADDLQKRPDDRRLRRFLAGIVRHVIDGDSWARGIFCSHVRQNVGH